MAFVVQTDDGLAAEANAYASVAQVRAYHTDRGLDLSATSDASLQAAVVRATQYLDGRFNFVGQRRNSEQTTEWPRTDAYDRSGYLVNGIPRAVRQAVSELASRALTATLLPDPERDASGRTVQSKSQQVGPIKEDVAYSGGAAFNLPEYPAADFLILSAGLVRSGLVAARA